MIALLIVSNEKREVKKYINDLVKKNQALLFEVEKEKDAYSINDIKDIIKKTKYYFDQRRIYFLSEFESSSLEAQNALLKLLEEPPKNVIFVLTTSNVNLILPTILSRVKIISLKNKTKNEVTEKYLSLFSKIKEKNVFFEAKTKEDALKIIDQMVIYFSGKIFEEKQCASIIKEIIRLRSLLINNNLNPQLTIDHILIFVRKKYSIK